MRLTKNVLSEPIRETVNISGAKSLMLSVFPVRLGIAMSSMALVWLIYQTTGSFATAGTIAGGYAVSHALVGPFISGLIDRYGQMQTLPWLIAGHAIAIVSIVIAASSEGHWALLLALALLAGSSLPNISALSMARWSHLIGDDPNISSAFTLEAMANELAFLIGPALAVLLATSFWPPTGIIVALIFIVTGGFSLWRCRSSVPPPSQLKNSQRTWSKKLFQIPFCVLLSVNLAQGIFFGSLQISISGFAIEHDISPQAGLLYGILSAAGILGGLIYTQRHLKTSTEIQLVVLLFALSFLTIPIAFSVSPLMLAVSLFLPGLTLAPLMAVSSVLVKNTVEKASLTMAFTLINSASVAGLACAAVLSGIVVDQFGARAGFWLPVTTMFAAFILVLATLKSFRSQNYN